MPRPTDPLCDCCAATIRPGKAVTATVCPRCRDALRQMSEEPPDFSDVVEDHVYKGESLEPGQFWPISRRGHACTLSAIVPLFRSEKYVRQCVDSLLRCLPAGSEIIAVDDGSLDRSGAIAEQVLRDSDRGLVVRLSRNTGFAHAVNVGARCASGEYLLMFNADAVARPGFVQPMLDYIACDPARAIVGNRHVRPDGSVDSKGSEWSWETRTFRHVGREISDPIVGDAANPDRPVKRDMVTFACCLIRRSVWQEIGGLDERYRVGYHEDADFCMRVRERGRRIVYMADPQTTITHVGSHSGVGHHAWWDANQRLFGKRWADSGKVDKFRRERGLKAHSGRVVICMIACDEEEFIAASLESVYPLADSIVIVEGGTQFAVRAGMCDDLGRSTDKTVEEIERFRATHDAARKVELVRSPGRPWLHKNEQRNEYVKRLRSPSAEGPGDWMFLVDADEVFDEEGLWRMSALMNGAGSPDGRPPDVISPTFFSFWNDMDTLGTGKWDDYRQAKVMRWRAGWNYEVNHNSPTDEHGRHVTGLPDVRVLKPPVHERLFYHYSWAGKTVEKLRKKLTYYSGQNTFQTGRPGFALDYFERVFIPWRLGDAERRRYIEKRFGTHPYGGGGTARFKGEHPEPVRRRFTTEARRHGGQP